jgi:hypothetical protein
VTGRRKEIATGASRRFRLPYGLLVPVALLLAVLPLGAEPHLVEKAHMLSVGALRRPIDILDLFLHGAPLSLLVLQLGLDGWARLGARGAD